MLQYPDFEEKLIVFIESYDAKNMNFENENLVIKEKGEIKNKISLYKIFCIFLMGETTLSSVIIRKFQEFGVTLVLMKTNFLPYLVIGNETEGNVILRKKQYEKTEGEMLHIAKEIIKIKTQSQLDMLKSIRKKDDELWEEIGKIEKLITKIPLQENYESLLGVEGNVAKIYFQTYFQSISWTRREARTKHDIPNLLLDIGYTYLFHFIEALLRLYGFDNYYGVYHRTWYQRKSLALDLMEPFRPLIDQKLLKAYHLGQIQPKDFQVRNGGYDLPWQNGKKYTSLFLTVIMEHKQVMFYFIKDYYKYFMKDREHFPEFSLANLKK